MHKQGINKEIIDGVLRLSWDNRRVRKDGCAFIGIIFWWLIWTPVTLGVTVWVVKGEGTGPRIFFTPSLIILWAGTISASYTLLQRSWSEWITVSADAISFGCSGFLSTKPKSVRINHIREITLGYCDDESMVTLNLHVSTNQWFNERCTLAYWLSPAHKEEIFHVVQNFAEAEMVPLKFRKFG